MTSDTSTGYHLGIQRLDYEKAVLKMDVTTPIEAAYRVNACSKEPWTVEFIEAQPPGSWFIDVGANVGPYTLVAIAHGLNVVAIEPSYESYRALCHNLALNNLLDKAIVVCAALSNGTGVNWFSYADLRAGGNGHMLGATKPLFHKQMIPIFRLDDLIQIIPIAEGQIISMKIDVDGAEGLVLEGASELLAGDRLRHMIIEIDRRNGDALVLNLESLGWIMEKRVDENSEAARFKSPKDRFVHMFYGQFAKPVLLPVLAAEKVVQS